MAVLCPAEHVDLARQVQEHPEHGRASQLVAAVKAPGGDDPVGTHGFAE